MRKFIFPLIFTFCMGAISCTRKRNYSVPAIYSENVKDSFELYIDLPPNYQMDSSKYSIVYYMDANLKMGKEIRRQMKLPVNQENLKNVIFIGVGHIGPYRKLRRRDFIPPVMDLGVTTDNKDRYFGHADAFYKFLTLELIPYINKKYPNNKKYSYIGHSFSGLFAFYCLFKEPTLFKNYVALSPSLWANNNNFYEYERNYFSKNYSLNAHLFHACGTGEWANKVLSTSREMNAILQQRNYSGFRYNYIEQKGKNHNGVVPVSLEFVFSQIKF